MDNNIFRYMKLLLEWYITMQECMMYVYQIEYFFGIQVSYFMNFICIWSQTLAVIKMYSLLL